VTRKIGDLRATVAGMKAGQWDVPIGGAFELQTQGGFVKFAACRFQGKVAPVASKDTRELMFFAFLNSLTLVACWTVYQVVSHRDARLGRLKPTAF